MNISGSRQFRPSQPPLSSLSRRSPLCTRVAAGFSHSAFTFAHESLVARSVVADAEVPPGALITFLQKGLQYVEVETHLQEVRTLLELPALCARPGASLTPYLGVTLNKRCQDNRTLLTDLASVVSG